MISSPRGSFSTITVGAPIIAEGTTSASSGTSSRFTSLTGPYSRIACLASSFPMYGLPPPPVPRTAAPTARSSRSRSPTSRNGLSLQLKVPNRLHPDPRRVARQVTQRDLFDVRDLDRAFARAGRHSLLGRLRLGLLQRRVTAHLVQREDTIHFAADLGDGGADGVRDSEVLRLDHVRRARQMIAEQDAAATDDHDRDRLGAGLHPVDGLGDAALHQSDAIFDDPGVQVDDARPVAEIRKAGSHGEVGRGQRLAAEDQSLAGQLVADALRADL